VHVTDVTNASRTQLLNLLTLDWDEKLLAAFDIPCAVLQRWVQAASLWRSEAKGSRGVPITGILGDQQAALVGRRAFGRAR